MTFLHSTSSNEGVRDWSLSKHKESNALFRFENGLHGAWMSQTDLSWIWATSHLARWNTVGFRTWIFRQKSLKNMDLPIKNR